LWLKVGTGCWGSQSADDYGPMRGAGQAVNSPDPKRRQFRTRAASVPGRQQSLTGAERQSPLRRVSQETFLGPLGPLGPIRGAGPTTPPGRRSGQQSPSGGPGAESPEGSGTAAAEAKRLRAEVADLRGARAALQEEAAAEAEARSTAAELQRQLSELQEREQHLQQDVLGAVREHERKHEEAVALLEAAADGAAAEQRRQLEAQRLCCRRLEDQLAQRDAWWRAEVQRLWAEVAGQGTAWQSSSGRNSTDAPRRHPSRADPEAHRLARAAIMRAIAPHAEAPSVA